MILSKTFDVRRGVIQGDIVSPIFLMLALDQLVQTIDAGNEGVRVGHIKKLTILGYADDAAMLASEVDEMTKETDEICGRGIERGRHAG